jgi:DNA-binding PadR family transcriptional regulator
LEAFVVPALSLQDSDATDTRQTSRDLVPRQYNIGVLRARYLSEFELHVLLAVSRLGDDAYGGSVRREIEERSGRRVWIGPLYGALGKLGDQGLVTAKMGDPLPVRGGRSRRYYRLTTAGARALRESLAMLDRMREGVRLRPEPRGAR